MPRTTSGPPVAVSSSAAAKSAEREVDDLVTRHTLAPLRLDPVAGVDPTRAVGLEVALLVLAAGGVVAEHAAAPSTLVVAGEERHDHESLHRGGEVRPHELSELVGLALEREGFAFDLLVVLELHLEELHELDGGPRGARDGDAGEFVGGEDLLHPPVGDHVAGSGAPVAGHHDALVVANREHRGAVHDVDGAGGLRAGRSVEPRRGKAFGRGLAEQLHERRARPAPGPVGGRRRFEHRERAYTDVLRNSPALASARSLSARTSGSRCSR